MWEIPPLSSGRAYPAYLGFEDWPVLAKRFLFASLPVFFLSLTCFFFQNDEPERIVSVFVTGGTDKVLLLWLYLCPTMNRNVLDFS